MRLIITRPRIDAAPLAEKLVALGHTALIMQVLDIVPRDSVAVPHLPYQAICLTSANGMRSLTVNLNRRIPVYAVGEQSASIARALGFHNVEAAGGDVDGLVGHIATKLKPSEGPLLYLSGAETASDLEGQLQKRGFDMTRVITYDAVQCALDNHLNIIASCDGVLLYSPRTAKLWCQDIQRLQFSHVAEQLRYFCLSAQVAKVLPQNWHRLVAKVPTEKSLLALLDLTNEAE